MAMGFDILIYILYPYYLYGFFKKGHINNFVKSLSHGLVRIPRRRTTSELGQSVGEELTGRNRALEQHGQGDRGVYVSTGNAAQHYNDEGQRATNYQRIASRKDRYEE